MQEKTPRCPRGVLCANIHFYVILYYMKTHWSVDEEALATHPEEYAKWKLEQRINFGVGEAKIRESELRKYWSELILDPWKRKALARTLGVA